MFSRIISCNACTISIHLHMFTYILYSAGNRERRSGGLAFNEQDFRKFINSNWKLPTFDLLHRALTILKSTWDFSRELNEIPDPGRNLSIDN